MDGPPPLLADVMLGKLARWLRLLGFDVLYDPHGEDSALLALALREDRVLLTRDVELAKRAGARGFLVRSLDPDEQVEEVVRGLRLPVDPERALTRCSLCNARLLAAAPREVVGRVPDGVLARHASFRRCPGCERVYWPGSHHARILERARHPPWEPDG